MKKAKRIVALLLTVIMCLSLCGCQNLEDMRAAHAFWQEDGSIKWNGNVYLPLKDVPKEMRFAHGSSVCVTEKDVPVLLSGIFGDTFNADPSGVLLCTMYYGEDEAYYCREDQYAYILEYLQQGVELNVLFYTYWKDYDADNPALYYLTEEQQKTIGDLLNTVQFAAVGSDFYESFDVDEYSLSLSVCDEKHWFIKESVLEIAWKDDKFYLVSPEQTIGEVPTEDYDVLRSIVRAYYKAEIEPYL